MDWLATDSVACSRTSPATVVSTVVAAGADGGSKVSASCPAVGGGETTSVANAIRPAANSDPDVPTARQITYASNCHTAFVFDAVQTYAPEVRTVTGVAISPACRFSVSVPCAAVVVNRPNA